jgi:polar amino acid transport system substrate-binding protein
MNMDRRTYLKTGAGTVATLTVAGCLGGGGGGGGGNQQIVAGTAPGFPPFEMKNDQGDLVGFDIDLLEAVVGETDYSLSEWKTFEFSSLIPALQNDRIDVIAAAMTINEERKKTISFSDPYYNADQSVLVRKGGDFQPSKLNDLGGRTVGAQEGTTGAGVVKNQLIKPGNLKQSNFNTYGNYVFAIEDLENGNIDAVVLDKPVAQTFASQRDVEVAFVYETGERYGFGIRQDASELQSALNSGLSAVEENGTYKEIRNEWFSQS